MVLTAYNAQDTYAPNSPSTFVNSVKLEYKIPLNLFLEEIRLMSLVQCNTSTYFIPCRNCIARSMKLRSCPMIQSLMKAILRVPTIF